MSAAKKYLFLQLFRADVWLQINKLTHNHMAQPRPIRPGCYGTFTLG